MLHRFDTVGEYGSNYFIFLFMKVTEHGNGSKIKTRIKFVCVDSSSGLSKAFPCLLLGRSITFICRERRPRSCSRDEEKSSMSSVCTEAGKSIPRSEPSYIQSFASQTMCALSSALIYYNVLDIVYKKHADSHT